MRRPFRNTLAVVRQFADRARWAGDLRTLRHFYRTTEGLQRLSVRFDGDRVPFWVRGGTLDAQIASQIIREDSEYRLPVECDPSVIFDVGANIGATSVYFALRYPNARVFAFEPLPENLDVLHRNLEPFGDRVTIVPMGLGDRPGTFRYEDTRRSLRMAQSEQGLVRLPVTTVAEICRASGIGRVDAMKIEAHGTECGVLAGMPPRMLSSLHAIVGTLYGADDWAVCQLLDRTHSIALTAAGDSGRHRMVATLRPQPIASYRLADAA